ncbi:mCG141244, partial [Mus musculus]
LGGLDLVVSQENSSADESHRGWQEAEFLGSNSSSSESLLCDFLETSMVSSTFYREAWDTARKK